MFSLSTNEIGLRNKLSYIFSYIFSAVEKKVCTFSTFIFFCLLTMPHSYIKETAINTRINLPNIYIDTQPGIKITLKSEKKKTLKITSPKMK